MKGKGSPGAFMNNGRGVCSYKDNPMGSASRIAPMCGPALGSPANSDQVKANKLLQRAQKEKDSLRGKNGM